MRSVVFIYFILYINNMKKFNITDVDVKLLMIFKAVYEQGSVTAASNELGLSQPLVSHALERLRSAFSDPLFVRAGRSIRPTVRASELAPDIGDIVERLISLAEPDQLDIQALTTNFRVSANDFERRILAPGVARKIFSEAPKASLSLSNTLDRIEERMRRRELDVVISPIAPPDVHDFYSEHLFDDQFVCFFDGDQLRAKDIQRRYCELQHAIVRFTGDGTSAVDMRLYSLGLSRSIQLVAPSFEALPELILGTPLVATLPSLLATSVFAEFDRTDFPFESPILDFKMIWHKTTHRSSQYQWLRSLIKQAASDT